MVSPADLPGLRAGRPAAAPVFRARRGGPDDLGHALPSPGCRRLGYADSRFWRRTCGGGSCGGISASGWPRRRRSATTAGAAEVGDLLLEVFYRGERAIDAREAQVCHLVQLAQWTENGQPDLVAGDLGGAPARTDSSTRCASCASASSSTGRPWQARRTPRTTFSRLNGSVTPLRLTTASTASSTVVNRRPQSTQERRRRVACPSSTSRESITRQSECRQNGHRITTSRPDTSRRQRPHR